MQGARVPECISVVRERWKLVSDPAGSKMQCRELECRSASGKGGSTGSVNQVESRSASNRQGGPGIRQYHWR